MTIDVGSKIAPLLIRQARLSNSVTRLQGDFADADDPLPHVVHLRADGSIAHRQTYVTDVRYETTDDN